VEQDFLFKLMHHQNDLNIDLSGQCFMGAVAIGLVLRMLTLAKEGGLGFLRLEDDGRERRVGLVGAVAEGLAFRMATGAPGVGFTRFQLHLCGKFLGDIGFWHIFYLLISIFLKEYALPRLPMIK
jgi:hypothetical protein